MPDREQAKELIREIVAVAGKRLAGKVRLHKAFYLAHLIYWAETDGVLSDYPIVRMPFGPGIDAAPDLLLELVEERKLRITYRPVGPYREEVFSLVSPMRLDRKSARYAAIKKAVDRVKRRTAVDLSTETHAYSLSWQEGRNGQELNIYLDLLTAEEYQQIKNEITEAGNDVDRVFGREGIPA